MKSKSEMRRMAVQSGSVRVSAEPAGNRKRLTAEMVVSRDDWDKMWKAPQMAKFLRDFTELLRNAKKYNNNPYDGTSQPLDRQTLDAIHRWIYAEATELGITDVLY